MAWRDCDPPPAQRDEPTLWRPALRLCSQLDSPRCRDCFHLSSLIITPLARASCPSDGGVSRVTHLLSNLDLWACTTHRVPKFGATRRTDPALCPHGARFSFGRWRVEEVGSLQVLRWAQGKEPQFSSILLFLSKKSNTCWSLARAFSSSNSVVEKNSIVLKEKRVTKDTHR